jgi:predicted amidohydrolase|tara:strand:+ start:351 stop:1136 length:786 start_codon:yes stop_codon:yes gene_type:complete
MIVSCIQLSSGENYKHNLKKYLHFVKKSINKNADLILTPEMTSIVTDEKNKLLKNSYTMEGDLFIKETKILCRKFKKWILIGSLPIKEKKRLKNRSILINPDGKIICYYDKINMFDVKLGTKEFHKESKIYKAGKKIVIAKMPFGNIGLSICFDLRFPELYRALSKKNLNFISVPSAFTKITGKKHWCTLLKARAIENFCYIFAPAQTGKNTKNRETYGHSMIISPDGKIIKEKKSGEGIIVTKINPILSMKLRKIIPSLI